MADRYWVGGTGTWNSTAGTKWATTSGGLGGASTPTSADNVFFDANSGAVTVSFGILINCANLNFTGFTGTISGSTNLSIYGDLTLATTTTYNGTGVVNFRKTTGTATITTNGKDFLNTIGTTVTYNFIGGASTTFDLVGALNCVTFTLQGGTFNTNNYSIYADTYFSIQGTTTRVFNAGSSAIRTGGSFNASGSNYTFNAGTSTVTMSAVNGYVSSTLTGGLTFYNLKFLAQGGGLTNITTVLIAANITVTNLLTAQGTAYGGTFGQVIARSDVAGTQRTLTCAAISINYAFFRDIVISGAAAPASGTLVGDCGNNSGITFTAARTVYFVSTSVGPSLTSEFGWSFSSGGVSSTSAWPLPQDTAVINDAKLPSGATIAALGSCILGSVDFSSRTLPVTFTVSNSNTTAGYGWAVYGNWTAGSGLSTTGNAQEMTFSGSGSTQTITKGSSQTITTTYIDGSATKLLAAAYSGTTMTIAGGTLSTAGYTVTMSSTTTLSGAASINLGGGTYISQGNFTGVSTATFSGGGTIQFSGTTFAGGGCTTYPTLDIYTASTVTVTGNNTFSNLTNTFASATTLKFTSSTTNTFASFNYTGASGKVCTLGASTLGQAILVKPTTWYMGANSTDGGNNINLTFAAGGGIDYLSVSYISGNPSLGGNFLAFF